MEPLHTQLSSPANAGDPVRRDFSIQSSASLEYWGEGKRCRSSKAKPGDDDRICVHDLAARCTRGLQVIFAPLKREGAGNAGCALHPRSRVQVVEKGCAHEHTGSAEAIRHSLRNGFTAYIVISPADRACCHRRPSEALASSELDASIGASGPHDFTVRSSCARPSQLLRPPRPVPRS
jgi:hypothetical protein